MEQVHSTSLCASNERPEMLVQRVRKGCNLADEARHVRINQRGEARRCTYMQVICAAKQTFTLASMLAAVTAFADGISRRDLDELASPRAFDTGESRTCTSPS